MEQMAFSVQADRAGLTLQGTPPLLTAGMQAVAKVTFTLSADWAALEKTAVFSNGRLTVDVPQGDWENSTCHIPAAILAEPGRCAMVGLYGTNGEQLILPTVWCMLGRIEPGAVPSACTDSPEPLPQWLWIRSRLTQLEQNAALPYEVTGTAGEGDSVTLNHTLAELEAALGQGKTLILTLSGHRLSLSTLSAGQYARFVSSMYEETGANRYLQCTVTPNGATATVCTLPDTAGAMQEFIVQMTSAGTADKTFAEIKQAISAGKCVTLYSQYGEKLQLEWYVANDYAYFTGVIYETEEEKFYLHRYRVDSNGWALVASAPYIMPEYGIPKGDLATDVQASLGKADSALQSHQSLSAYRTSAAQDVIDSGKVDKEAGKGLSENDYDAAEKGNVAANTSARHSHANSSVLEGITAALVTAWNTAVTWITTNGAAVLSHISNTVNHITNAERSTWNAKSDFSGSYTDLTDKPTIPQEVTESTVTGWGFTKNTGTYSKPSGGIPDTDLSAGVNASLDKADTAIQPADYNPIAKSSGMTQQVGKDTDGTLWTTPGGGGGGGTSDHSQLINRDMAEQHPISAITGLQDELDGKGTYSKPSGGIPKTDLASAVQTSLEKADSALQSHQSLAEYRTSAEQDVIDAGKYEKPSGGIPDTDLSVGVNASLDKADTAIQPSDYNPEAKTSGMTQAVGKDSSGKLWTTPGGGGGGGTSDHSQLINRDMAEQHPISAITGLQDELDGKGTYSKPSGGIPKTDLASAVQTSLEKADSALQSHQSLAAYRTSAEQDVIDAGKYEKPAGGIPASDLASGVIPDISGKQDKRTISKDTASSNKTITAYGNYDYIMGTVTQLVIVFLDGTDGQEIHFQWYSGSTATTLTVSGSNVKYEPIVPAVNSYCELSARWYLDKWVVIGKVVE